MLRIPVYIRNSFLSNLFDSAHESDSSVKTLQDLIRSKSILNIDVVGFTKEEQENPYFKNLIKRSVTGGSKLQFLGNDFEQKLNCISELPRTSLFALDKTELVNLGILNDYRLIGFHQENFFNIVPKLSVERSEFADTDSENSSFISWEAFLVAALPVSSLLISDAYILQDRKRMDENLIPILNILVNKGPARSVIEIDILTSDIKSSESDFNKKIEYIKDRLQWKEEHNVEISVFILSKQDVHSRSLFTNYFVIESDHSFTYFKDGLIAQNGKLTYLAVNSPGYNANMRQLMALKNRLGPVGERRFVGENDHISLIDNNTC